MAEGIRGADQEVRDPKAVAIAEECGRQSESALYTSTALFIWLREARWTNRFFIVTPVILGAASGITFFQSPQNAGWASVLAIIAGLFPAVRDALRLDIHLDQIKTLAAEYKMLQDGFRQVEKIYAPSSSKDAEARMRLLMDQLERARSHSMTIPERVFKAAQKKIDSGDYDFTVDIR
jgi:hypothetical protein